MAISNPVLQQVSIASEVACREMIKTHLARIIEIDSGFDLDERKTIHRSDVCCSTIFGANLTQEGICSINQLIKHIGRKNNVTKKGIFRVSGSQARQIELQNLISIGQTILIDTDKFSVHDCCGVLKRFLSDLPQPLLTENLQNLFLKTLNIQDFRKRLDAIRLLVLLLPSPNQAFLYDLLVLFQHVVKHSEQNLMTVDNISTIFAMHFFRMDDSNSVSNSLNVYKRLEACMKCLSFMIENVAKVFQPPESLIIDAQQYLANREKIKQNHSQDLISSTNLAAIPAAKFCATKNESYSAKDYTEMQLAELYAQVQTMAAQSPAIRKKFLKKFNQNKNGFGTPLLQRDKQQQELIKRSMKKSSQTKKKLDNHHSFKSFGAAIKKKFTLTPSNKSDKPTLDSPHNISVRGSISPRSIVPVIEDYDKPTINDTNQQTNTVNDSDSKSIASKSKIPVAIITPMDESKNRLFIKDNVGSKNDPNCFSPKYQSPSSASSSSSCGNHFGHHPTPIRSKSNSVISSVRISSLSKPKHLCTILEYNKENRNISTVKSLPANFNHPKTLDTDSEFKRKRVKYLALKYEELIANNSKNSEAGGGPVNHRKSKPKSSSSSSNPTVSLNDSVNSESYVSLTSIYTNELLDKSRKITKKKLSPVNRSGSLSVSMRKTEPGGLRYNGKKHTVL